jgi:hypothetical protein
MEAFCFNVNVCVYIFVWKYRPIVPCHCAIVFAMVWRAFGQIWRNVEPLQPDVVVVLAHEHVVGGLEADLQITKLK